MINTPELVGDSWINSKPLTKDDLKGKVVLYDFWTYSCVNCHRTLPYLKEWWAKYKDKNFVLIGIHTPEFDFEKVRDNVEKACLSDEVTWPVVQDNEYLNWNNFANHYWPAKYLADINGKIVYTHFGEGGYAETEAKIQELLGEASAEEMPKIEDAEHAHGNVCFRPTPETYCGYSRGVLSNASGYKNDEVFDYIAPDELPQDSIALSGRFIASGEYVEAQESGATLTLNFKATEVNLVFDFVGEPAIAEIKLNDNMLPDAIKGKDVNGSGEALINKAHMYNLLLASGLTEGKISITAKSGKFRAYAFTFSGCEK